MSQLNSSIHGTDFIWAVVLMKKVHIVIIPTLTNIVHVLKRIRNAYYNEYLAPASQKVKLRKITHNVCFVFHKIMLKINKMYLMMYTLIGFVGNVLY